MCVACDTCDACAASAQAWRFFPAVLGAVALPVGVVFGTIGFNVERAVRVERAPESVEPVWVTRAKRVAAEESARKSQTVDRTEAR